MAVSSKGRRLSTVSCLAHQYLQQSVKSAIIGYSQGTRNVSTDIGIVGKGNRVPGVYSL